MSKKQRAKSERPVMVPSPAPGGALVAVHRAEVKADGNLNLTFDLGKLPAPQRRYLADAADVSVRDGMVHVMFGQRSIGSDSLRSILILALFPHAVSDFVRSCEAMRQSLDDYFQAGGRKLALSKFEADAPQTVTMTANIIIVAMTGDETCLDCFNFSPFANRAVASGAGRVPIDPVVRIDLHTSLFAAILATLKNL